MIKITGELTQTIPALTLTSGRFLFKLTVKNQDPYHILVTGASSRILWQHNNFFAFDPEMNLTCLQYLQCL